jgi:two-component system response regulator AtoC
MKLGAFDYLMKPLKVREILETVDKAVEIKELMNRTANQWNANEKIDSYAMIGFSDIMQNVYKTIGRVANTNATVLIRGESGTGKELVARAIHRNSVRHNRPFIKINCASIPENLLESELFGYEKGAFTGAVSSKPGKFELANKGTLFFDEIGEMSLNTQAKILRVLQEKEFERVGGTETIRVDVRIISATNKDLEKSIEEASFREDLFYRLNVVEIMLPPLRERKSDIPDLIRHIIKNCNAEYNKAITGFSGEAMALLKNYDWPGNVRELENTVERIYVMISNDKLVTPDILVKYGLGLDLGTNSQAPAVTVHRIATLREIMDEAEGQLLAMAVEKYRGIKEIALALGVDQSTVSRKLKILREKNEFPIRR